MSDATKKNYLVIRSDWRDLASPVLRAYGPYTLAQANRLVAMVDGILSPKHRVITTPDPRGYVARVYAPTIPDKFNPPFLRYTVAQQADFGADVCEGF